MPMKIESTAEHASEDLARAGVPRTRPVVMVVLDDDDEAKLADLRAAIAEGDASDEVDGEDAFAEIQRHLSARS